MPLKPFWPCAEIREAQAQAEIGELVPGSSWALPIARLRCPRGIDTQTRSQPTDSWPRSAIFIASSTRASS